MEALHELVKNFRIEESKKPDLEYKTIYCYFDIVLSYGQYAKIPLKYANDDKTILNCTERAKKKASTLASKIKLITKNIIGIDSVTIEKQLEILKKEQKKLEAKLKIIKGG